MDVGMCKRKSRFPPFIIFIIKLNTMADYTGAQLSGAGIAIPELTAGAEYRFVMVIPTTLNGSGYFTVETVKDAKGFYDSSTSTIIGSLLATNTVTCDIGTDASPYTATIKDVPGGAFSTDGDGSGLEIAITSTGWDGVNGSGTGVLTKVVVVDGGNNYAVGDTITIARGTPGVQGLGFTNADNPLIITLSEVNLSTSPTNAIGTYTDFVNTPLIGFITSSYISSIVCTKSTPTAVSYKFSPTVTIAAGSSMLRSTGNIGLQLNASIYIFTTKAELQTAVDLWVSDNTAALATYGEINTWDVSAITDMASLFIAKNAFNSDISNWDVSSVTDMRNMFANTNTFNQPIGNWVVSSVTNMDSMFFGANAFNSNINDWDVSSVTNMGGMFAGAFAFQSPLNLWEVDSLTNADQFMGLTGNANAITYTLLDTLYNGWVVDIAAMQSNVTISFGDSKFTSAGLAAKNILAGAPLNWTITDNGQV